MTIGMDFWVKARALRQSEGGYPSCPSITSIVDINL